MGLFDKKNCAVCGAKIGLLGGKKLSDGSLCKDCSKKLSPWFDEYSSSSAADISSQLEQREHNREALESFSITYSAGDFGCIMLDENAKKFIAVDDSSEKLFGERGTITDISQVIGRNPDIIGFSQVRDVTADIKETHTEEMKQEGDRKVSYHPRRFIYKFTFAMVINVDHPYIKKLRIPLTSSPCRVRVYGETSSKLDSILKTVITSFDPGQSRVRDFWGFKYHDDTFKDLQECERWLETIETVRKKLTGN